MYFFYDLLYDSVSYWYDTSTRTGVSIIIPGSVYPPVFFYRDASFLSTTFSAPSERPRACPPAPPLLRCRCRFINASRKWFSRPVSASSTTTCKLSEFLRERRLCFFGLAPEDQRVEAAVANLPDLRAECIRRFGVSEPLKFPPLPGPMVELLFLIFGWLRGSLPALLVRWGAVMAPERISVGIFEDPPVSMSCGGDPLGFRKVDVAAAAALPVPEFEPPADGDDDLGAEAREFRLPDAGDVTAPGNDTAAVAPAADAVDGDGIKEGSFPPSAFCSLPSEASKCR